MPTRFVRVDPEQRSLWRTEYLGPPPSVRGPTIAQGTADFVPPPADSPQSFRIEQDAGIVVEPHFHYVNQFQVVVAGSATIGRSEVGPIAVHYAGAFDEEPGDFEMAISTCYHERRYALFIFSINVGAFFDEKSGDFEMAILTCYHERRPAI